MHASLIEVLNEDYVRTARAKGQRESLVIWRHAVRNALIPVVTVAGLQLGYLLGGAVVTETVFAWPGLGRLLVQSIFARDFPVVQAAVLLLASDVRGDQPRHRPDLRTAHGVYGNVIRFQPPLIITRPQIDRAIAAFAAALQEVAQPVQV